MPSKPPTHRPPGYKPVDVRRREYDRARSAEKNATYDTAWRKLRAVFIKAHPKCCEPGCDMPATDADHIKGVADHPELRLAWSNLRPLCHAHHSARTSREQSWNRARPR